MRMRILLRVLCSKEDTTITTICAPLMSETNRDKISTVSMTNCSLWTFIPFFPLNEAIFWLTTKETGFSFKSAWTVRTSAHKVEVFQIAKRRAFLFILRATINTTISACKPLMSSTNRQSMVVCIIFHSSRTSLLGSTTCTPSFRSATWRWVLWLKTMWTIGTSVGKAGVIQIIVWRSPPHVFHVAKDSATAAGVPLVSSTNRFRLTFPAFACIHIPSIWISTASGHLNWFIQTRRLQLRILFRSNVTRTVWTSVCKT